jgi:hypothetical protein
VVRVRPPGDPRGRIQQHEGALRRPRHVVEVQHGQLASRVRVDRGHVAEHAARAAVAVAVAAVAVGVGHVEHAHREGIQLK